MTTLVDAHCHLDCLDRTQYEGGLIGILQRAEANHVGHMLCPGVTLTAFPEVLALAEQFSQVSCALALHPSEQVEMEPTVDDLIALADHSEVVGIGETGLDYHYDFVTPALQRERFEKHIRAAIAIKKPLIIHMREASEDCFHLLKKLRADQVGGMMHCFSGTLEEAQRAMDLNFMISFSGIVTFKNALALKEIAKKIPLECLLVETDSPYLTPVPKRSLPNEPAYVRYIAEYLAQLRELEFEVIAKHTTENFNTLFLDTTLT